MEVIPEQYLSDLQLFPKNFKKVLMGQGSTLVIYSTRGGRDEEGG